MTATKAKLTMLPMKGEPSVELVLDLVIDSLRAKAASEAPAAQSWLDWHSDNHGWAAYDE